MTEHSPFEDSDAEDQPAPPAESKNELVPQPHLLPRPTREKAGGLPARPTLRVVVERALDVLDATGDAIAVRLGLR